MQVPGVSVRILPEREDRSDYDGERHIETSVASWDSQDLIVLDPFAMWRQARDSVRRARYRRIFDAVTAKGQDAPLLMLFWTWGRAFPVAEGDLNGTNSPVDNGYQMLRNTPHRAVRHFIRIEWRWGLQFAMWVVVPDAHLGGLRQALEQECNATRNHLLDNGCGGRLETPDIHVAID